MKKKLFGLMVLVLLALMMVVGTANADAPQTFEERCSTCEKATTWTFIRWEIATVTHHAGYYKCNEQCGNEGRWINIAEAHTIIPATCTTDAYCTKCDTTGFAYLIGMAQGHAWDDWVSNGDGTHTRTCANNASHTETNDCSGGTATCTEVAKCEVCATAYGDPLGHTPGAAATCTTDQLCTREGCGAVLTEKLGHIPGAAATCTTDQFCTREGCGAVLAEKLGHIPGAAATCTTDQLCTREGCGEVLAEKLGHDWGVWADNGDGTHTRICGNDAAHTETADCTWGPWVKLNEQHHERRCTVCNAQEVEEHTGGTATCSEPCTCDVCGDHYGSPDSSGLTGHPNPTIEVLPATCLIDGYYHIICDVPGCSAPFTEIILPAYGQHLYNYWNILGDCEHHTACDLCGEDASVGCTLFGMLEGETLLTVCPVCGDFGETPFEVLIAREDVAVPIGTLLVRGLKAPIPDALWGFTVAGVYGGEVVDIHGTVTVTLPVDLTELDGFTVVRVDMVDGEEIRTEIPFALEDGLLTIETDTAGLFLLVSAN